jgi:Zn-dependent protease with chaperone function
MYQHLFALIITLFVIEISKEILISYPLPEFFLPIAPFLGFICAYVTIFLQYALRKKFCFKNFCVRTWLSKIFLFIAILNAMLMLPAFCKKYGIEMSNEVITLSGFLCLFGYLLGLWIQEFSKNLLLGFQEARKQAIRVVLFLFPFAVPYLILGYTAVFLDFNQPAFLQNLLEDPILIWGYVMSVACAIAFVFFVLMPPLLKKFWLCSPLEEGPQKQKLEELAKEVGFKKPKICHWEIMDKGLAAAIIGIFPSLRYVLFSRRVLKELSLEELQAVFAHEIGHHHHRHLFFYPLVLFGIPVLFQTISIFFWQSTEDFFYLKHYMQMGKGWLFIFDTLVVTTVVLIVFLYLRIVFGYFSRNFERQADLFIFKTKLPVAKLIRALDYLAVNMRVDVDEDNWHHFGVTQRVEFLLRANASPSKIKGHHFKVKLALLVFLLSLGTGLIFNIAYLNNHPLARDVVKNCHKNLDLLVNQSSRKEVVAYHLYSLKSFSKDDEAQEAIIASSRKEKALSIPAMLELYATQYFFEHGEYSLSLVMFEKAMERISIVSPSQEVIEEFEKTFKLIISNGMSKKTRKGMDLQLREAIKEARKIRASFY